MSEMSSSSSITVSTSSDVGSSESDDELKTPKKRRYRRKIHHGEWRNVRARVSHRFKDSQSRPDTNSRGVIETPDISVDYSEFQDLAEPVDVPLPTDAHSTETTSSSLSDTSTTSSSDTDSEDITTSTPKSEESDQENDNSNTPNTPHHLQQPLYEGSKHTVHSAYMMIMLYVMKHSSSREAFSDLLMLIKDLLPTSAQFTTSVYMLKETLKKSSGFTDPKIHFFCEDCQAYLQPGQACTSQVCQQNEAKVKEFFDLRLLEQLKNLFQDDSFLKMIKNEDKRNEQKSGLITDIVHGKVYTEMANQYWKTSADITLTFTLNTDGVALFSSSKKGSLWPVYLAVNELPVKLRFSRKYLLPCLLHCHVEKPNMLTYLSPLMRDLQLLHDTGIQVTTSGRKFLLKARLVAVSTDLPARALVLNMKQFNGKFSCSMCLEEGACLPGKPLNRFYPYKDTVQERTHQSMLDDAGEACRTGDAVHGMKGVSALMILKDVDLPKTFVIDWMHNVLLGVTKGLLAFWLGSNHKEKQFYIGNKIQLMNQRLMKIQIPDYISRRQRGLEEHAHWKASELREWLIHFSVPVLTGILPSYPLMHYILFVTALSLLTKDLICQNDVDKAEQLLLKFCELYPGIYGITSQTMNVHLLRHLANLTRLHGPLFSFSCFGFESMNAFLKKMVHGTRHIYSQVSFAVIMSKQLTGLLKQYIDDMGDTNMKHLAEQLGSKFILENCPETEETLLLGKTSVLSTTNGHFSLLTSQMKKNTVVSFQRLQKGATTYHSVEYSRSKTRNNYIVTFLAGDQERLGEICIFLKCGKHIYAVINEYSVLPFTLNSTTRSELQNTNLSEYSLVSLCPQLFQIKGFMEKRLVNVNDLGKKCVLMKINQHLKYISKPPNIVEHG